MIHRTIYLLILTVSVLMIGIACEGPEGPQGPQGEQGPEDPVGPAGEEGSMIYAGESAPGDDIGAVGDYYLNQNTGELYGPKIDDGWGEPGIVLKGEDGQDGQDGTDGQDGEDGSQIHSGSGAPAGSLGKVGDFYLDKSSYELYGPKTGSGWGSPLNLKGADGNANVTRYIFPGNDFNSNDFIFRAIPDIESEATMRQSAWLTYLIHSTGRIYQITGYGINGSSFYRVFYDYDELDNEVEVLMKLVDGVGEEYEQIEVVRMEASSTEDHTKRADDNIIPDHLDVSNYEEVAEYYGFSGGL